MIALGAESKNRVEAVARALEEAGAAEELLYFSVLTDEGDIEFRAGVADFSHVSGEIARVMSAFGLKRVYADLEEVKLAVLNIGQLYVAVASDREQSVGMVITMIEKILHG